MEAVVSITLGTGAYVPARIGGEPVWQEPVSTISVGTAPRVVISGMKSELVLSNGLFDVSEDVPAKLISAGDHAAIVGWWSIEVERQEAERETIRIEAERDEVIRRLAAKARKEGVQLYRDARDGRYYASSVSHPGKFHFLTGISCDCQGFATYQRCKHHSALLVALGWLTDETIEPDPIHLLTAA
jgi:hypothetical protein